MAKLKQNKKYYFSVEGETEQWYLKWLQNRINEIPEAKYKVSFDCPVQKNPLKRAKSLVVTGKTDIYHISDYESDDEIHVKEFKETMDDFKHENNFKRVLSQLILSDVKDAIRRAKLIMQRNEENGYVIQEYKGYRYYRENPSLAIWEVIEKIMRDCELS